MTGEVIKCSICSKIFKSGHLLKDRFYCDKHKQDSPDSFPAYIDGGLRIDFPDDVEIINAGKIKLDVCFANDATLTPISELVKQKLDRLNIGVLTKRELQGYSDETVIVFTGLDDFEFTREAR